MYKECTLFIYYVKSMIKNCHWKNSFERITCCHSDDLTKITHLLIDKKITKMVVFNWLEIQ